MVRFQHPRSGGKRHTSRTLCSNIDVTSTGIGVWKSRQLSDEWMRAYTFLELSNRLSLDRPLSEPATRSHVVNVLLDVGWHMILFTRNIMGPGSMLPEVEVGDE